MRYWALLLTILLLLPAGTLTAHDIAVVAAVSTSGKELTVRLIDPYGAPVEGAATAVRFAAADKPPGSPNRLQERSKGRFVGQVGNVGAGLYDIVVEVTLAGDLLRSSIRARAGEDLGEVLLPLAVAVHPEETNWSLWLLVAAAFVVLAATGLALLRQRRREAAEGDEENA